MFKRTEPQICNIVGASSAKVKKGPKSWGKYLDASQKPGFVLNMTLLAALRDGNGKAAKKALARGADPCATDYNGKTAFDYARENHRRDKNQKGKVSF